jgi:hypothetical protein
MVFRPRAARPAAANSRTEAAKRIKPSSTAPVHFFEVIPEIDIWRAATLMLKRYGDKAVVKQSDLRVGAGESMP